MSKRFAQTISGMVGTSDNEKRYIHKKLADFEDSSQKVSTIVGNESDTDKYPNTKAVYDFTLSQLQGALDESYPRAIAQINALYPED